MDDDGKNGVLEGDRMDATFRTVSGRKAGRMTIISAILLAGGMIAIAIA